MQVRLAFGKTGAVVQVPQTAEVLEPRFAAALPDPAAAIAEAVAVPAAGPPLVELARGKKSAAISVCDITRPAPNKLVLPAICSALEAGGIAPENIRILIATGLHREATDAELDEILGPELRGRYWVDSHRAKNLDEQTHLGRTEAGTEIYVDSRFVEADMHLTVGFIEPHLMAGFSGGRKLISIGLAGERTIKRLHSPLYMRDAAATEGVFPDNPLHRELVEIASRVGHHFMVDVALTGDRGIAAVFAGEPVETHKKGVEFVRRSTLATLDEPADLVVTTSGGYPLDLTYYQTAKGVTAAAHIVKEGGTILVCSECAEGVGSPEFTELVRTSPDPEGLLKELADRPVAVDQWQAEKLAMVTRKAKLAFCTPGVPEADRASLWGPVYDDPQGALDAELAKLPAGARVVVIPEGPYVFAQLEREPALV